MTSCVLKKITFYVFLLNLFSCTHSRHGHHHPGEMNKEFLSENLDLTKWKKNFSDEQRDVVRFKKEIVDALKLKKGQRIADVGAGTGLFIPPLANQVTSSGKVYAVDISPTFVKELRDLTQKEKLAQVEVVLGDLKKTNLKRNSVETILVVDTYHHFDDPQAMLLDFKKILRPKGRLVIVDFDKTPQAREWIQNHIRLTKDGFIKEIEKSGFKFVSEENIPFKENFMLIFVLR